MPPPATLWGNGRSRVMGCQTSGIFDVVKTLMAMLVAMEVAYSFPYEYQYAWRKAIAPVRTGSSVIDLELRLAIILHRGSAVATSMSPTVRWMGFARSCKYTVSIDKVAVIEWIKATVR